MADPNTENDLSWLYTRRNGNNRPAAGVSLIKEQRPEPPKQVVDTQKAEAAPSERTLAAFLFSVSKTDRGEYWPLYMGSNTLGCTDDNSVVLGEKSISEHHAELTATPADTTVQVVLTDKATGLFTAVNGQRLFGESKSCSSGDIITIGENYQLLLLVADKRRYQLAPLPTFTERTAEADLPDDPIVEDGTVVVSEEPDFDAEATKAF